MKTIKLIAAALLTASTLVIPGTALAKGGAPSGGTCVPITASASATVKLAGGLASPLVVSGTIRNCTPYLKRFRVNFSEPARPASGGLNMPVVTCTADAFILPVDYVQSGGSLGFSKTINITPVAVTDPSTCLGAHSLRIDLIDRGLGTVLGSVTLPYSVVS